MLRYRSGAGAIGTRLSGRLFAAPPRSRRSDGDPQAAIRAAIRRRRRTLGLTQEAAARLLGLSRLSDQRLESGARRIDFAELAALCVTYHCHIGELIQDGALARAFIDAAQALLGRPPS